MISYDLFDEYNPEQARDTLQDALAISLQLLRWWAEQWPETNIHQHPGTVLEAAATFVAKYADFYAVTIPDIFVDSILNLAIHFGRDIDKEEICKLRTL